MQRKVLAKKSFFTGFGPSRLRSWHRSHVGGGLFRSVTVTETTVQLQNLLAAKGDTDGARDVDICDFNGLTNHFDPDGATAPHWWFEGNCDGDNDVDITDFNYLAGNFAPEGYGTSAVSELASVCLLLAGLLSLGWVRF